MTAPTRNKTNARDKEAASSRDDGAIRKDVDIAAQKEMGAQMSNDKVSETGAGAKKHQRVNFGVLLLLVYGVVLLFYIANLSTDLMSRSESEQVRVSSTTDVVQGAQTLAREGASVKNSPTVADSLRSEDYGIDVATIRMLLEPHGWTVAPDNEGGVLLFPRPPPAPTSSSVSRVPPDPSYEPLDANMLRSLLAPHGWRVESDGVGGVLLIPRGSNQ